MAATIRSGIAGPLAVTSVRSAGSAEGSMLQHSHVLTVEAVSKDNRRGAFAERADRLFETPFALKAGIFEVKWGEAEKDRAAVSTRKTARKLQDSSDDQCGSAVTVTSERYSDAEGCYELTEDGYYISSDNEHVIAVVPLAEGTGTETELGWIYGEIAYVDEFDRLVVEAECLYEDDSVLPGEIDTWLCDVDGNGTVFEEVEAEEFSTSCGCATTTSMTMEPTTIMPTEAGTHGDTPAPSAGETMTASMTDEPATLIPTEAGTHGGDTPAPSAGETATASMTKEPVTPVPTEAGTHGGDTPAPSAGETMTASMTEEPATPAPSVGYRDIGSMTNISTVLPSPSPAHITHTPASSTAVPTQGPQALYPTYAPTQTTHSPMFTPTLSPTSVPTSISYFPTTSFTASPTHTMHESTHSTHAPTSVVDLLSSSTRSPMDATLAPSYDDRGIDGSASPSGSPTLGGFVSTGSTMFPKMSIFGIVGAGIVAVLVGPIIHTFS